MQTVRPLKSLSFRLFCTAAFVPLYLRKLNPACNVFWVDTSFFTTMLQQTALLQGEMVAFYLITTAMQM